ncbi:hypothetical protein EIP86_001498 [Pleurotus ostreatoroseus]|nr:hypothetical protein EIP86_001498 [Pleurotus ostreatoroseus]
MSNALVSSVLAGVKLGAKELYNALRGYLSGEIRREASQVQSSLGLHLPELPLQGAGSPSHEKDETEATSPTQAQGSSLGQPEALPQKQPPQRAVLYMLAFFVIAALLMTAHHFFYAFLDGRPAASYSLLSTLRLPFTITNQSLVNAISNGIAITVQYCLTAVIGCAFAQAFWWRMPRSQSQNDPQFKKISDEVLNFHDNPLNVKAWPALINMPILALISVCGSLLAASNVVSPGSLTVTTNAFDEACRVSSANLSLVNLTTLALPNAVDEGTTTSYASPNAQALSLVTRVLMAGTYFAPPSPCGTCQYNVSFAAPAIQCTNMTETTNLPEWLPDWEASNEDIVWNATFSLADPYLRLASRAEALAYGGSALLPSDQLPVVALQCAAYNATYYVAIEQNVTTLMSVNHIDFREQLVPNITASSMSSQTDSIIPTKLIYEISALWNALATQLTGTVVYDRAQDGFVPGSSWLAWSALNGASQTGGGAAWQWAGDLQTVVPEIMQNVSLSLVAWQQGQNAPSSSSNASSQESKTRALAQCKTPLAA